MLELHSLTLHNIEHIGSSRMINYQLAKKALVALAIAAMSIHLYRTINPNQILNYSLNDMHDHLMITNQAEEQKVTDVKINNATVDNANVDDAIAFNAKVDNAIVDNANVEEDIEGISLQDIEPSVPVWNGSCCPLKFAHKSFPKTAMASHPGSGNTWVRHLIQQLTGKFLFFILFICNFYL